MHALDPTFASGKSPCNAEMHLPCLLYCDGGSSSACSHVMGMHEAAPGVIVPAARPYE